MFEPSPIFLPMLILVVWTIIQLGWMAATRLPAIAKADLGPTAGQRTADLADQLPTEIQWKADNYNHLLEQPTIFYATAIAAAIVGADEGLNLYMAWLYVGSRVVHSIVHSTVNIVPVRFLLFLVGTVAVLVMAGNIIMKLI